jgi:AcrR family transcriptional regulator
MAETTEVRAPKMTRRRLEILTVARRLLAERGFDGTTMADIANEVGVVESALYRHFKSKQELFAETVRVFYEPLVQELEAASQGISDPLPFVRYVIWRHIRSYAEEPELNQLVVIHARRIGHDGQVDREVAALNRRYTSVLLRALTDGIKSGRFRTDLDPRLARDMIYGLIEHTWLRHAVRGTAMDVDQLTESIFSMIEVTLVPRPGNVDGLRGEVDRLASIVEELKRTEGVKLTDS